MTRRGVLSLVVACSHFISVVAPASAQLRAGVAPSGAVPVRAALPLAAPMTAPALNPALPGGIRVSGVTPTLTSPSVAAAVNAASPAQAAAVSAVLPAVAAPASVNAARPASVIPSALPAKAAEIGRAHV